MNIVILGSSLLSEDETHFSPSSKNLRKQIIFILKTKNLELRNYK